VLTHADLDAEVNLAEFFLDRNLEAGRADVVAVRTLEGDCTYGQLARRANQVGNALRSLGIRREDRVLLALGDGVDFIAAWYGAVKIGAVVAEVYTFLADKDLEYYLRYTGCRAVVADSATLPTVRRVRQRVATLDLVLVCGMSAGDLEADEVDLDTLALGSDPGLDPVMISKDDVALWKFTTGSTGSPKGVVHLAHAPILSFSAYAEGVLGLRPSDIVLPVPKLFFGYARDLAALFPFGIGASSVIYGQRPTPELLFELIERFRPTILVQVPTMMRAMLEHGGASSRDLSSVRLCISSGEGLPSGLCEEWQVTFGHEVLEGIGSSECYHVYASNRPGHARAGSVGHAVPGYATRIVGPDGSDVPQGGVGELHVKAPSAAVMYWRDRPKSQTTFVGEWVRTGDLFESDADGFLRSRGRADDLIKAGGIWVAPAEIEACLIGHPDVVECAVVAYQERELDLPRAFVVLRPGVDLDAPALQRFVRGRLSPHKYPRDVRALEVLPKTPGGKVDRKALATRPMEQTVDIEAR
jgi:benzoate-CoA ligase family protein